ncbi:hypothetical protein ACFL6I_11410 [candidate division KSB1 bacterium]
MNKEQITEIIKTNSKLPYEEVKKQALEAGIPEEEFDECWKKNDRAQKMKIIGFLVLTIGTTALLAPLAVEKNIGSGYSMSLPFFHPVVVLPLSAGFYAMFIFGNPLLKFLATLLVFVVFGLYIMFMYAMVGI